MLLKSALVENYKSIDNSGEVPIDEDITVLVGQNESGKTAFLEALNKTRPVIVGPIFELTGDYPRKAFTDYQRKYKDESAPVVHLTYELTAEEVQAINERLGMDLLEKCSFTLHYHYDNSWTIGLSISEAPYIKFLLKDSGLSTDTVNALGEVTTVLGLIEGLEGEDLNDEEKAFNEKLRARFPRGKDSWTNLLAYEIWTKEIQLELPKFFYFDDYYLLPGKINIPTLTQRLSNPAQMDEEDKTVQSLLRMAGVKLTDLADAKGYENIKARLEGLSNSITDRIFKYWKQNQELDVEFDIRPDPSDRPPFNSGTNLYVRIKNRRHRASVPFNQRSKGFIWFFSFVVWFDAVKLQEDNTELILLLDEPGLSLHALGQADLLDYIDDLAKEHQLLYTTHSPFMIRGDRLQQVRLVEDKKATGTEITNNVMGTDPKTIFPLQAALGYTIAQNLFIAKRNLLVEGPAELVYLKFFSAQLEAVKKTGLRDDVVIVPAGGLDKVATFIALLGANQLDLAVLHDYAGGPDQRIESLVHQKMIRDRQVLNYAMFRNGQKGKVVKGPPSLASTDIEDLISLPLYLKLFNGAFEKQLGKTTIAEADLPPGDRVIDRLNRHLDENGIKLRARGGFNHYTVATYLVSNPPRTIDKDTLGRFEALFAEANGLFKPNEYNEG